MRKGREDKKVGIKFAALSRIDGYSYPLESFGIIRKMIAVFFRKTPKLTFLTPRDRTNTMAIKINVPLPQKVTRLLSGIVFFLVLANLLGRYSKYYLFHDYLCGFVPLFYGEEHGNIPHWFKAMCMLIIAIILYFIYKIQQSEQARFQKHWLFLSYIFFLMNIVQSSNIHNHLSPFIRSWLRIKDGWFYFAWVIPAVVIVIALGITYLRFFINLPRRTRRLFFSAALLYVIGAIVLEMATAYYMDIMEGFTFGLLSCLHETMKMAGLVLFIHAIMDYWSSINQPISLLVSVDNAQSLCETAAWQVAFPLPSLRAIIARVERRIFYTSDYQKKKE